MSWRKPIVFSRRVVPNYLWHLLAVARIGYDSDYAARFAHTVDAAGVGVLQKYRPRLQFANDEGGDLTGLYTFLPSWLYLESRKDLARYFEVLSSCFVKGSLQGLATAFKNCDWSDPFMAHVPSVSLSPEPGDLEAVCELNRVYMANYDQYEQAVWPEAFAAMEQRELDLQAWAAKRDYIALWEVAFHIDFASPDYEIVLCYANRNGPDYNSLGYRRNLFYHGKAFDQTWQFVSHEVGTHLLYSTMVEVRQEASSSQASLYRAYEVMAMFLNQRVLNLQRLAYDLPESYRQGTLLRLYAEIYRDGMAPAELLRQGAQRLDET
jgi:hypothetical protein